MVFIPYPYPMIMTLVFGLSCLVAEAYGRLRVAAVAKMIASSGFVLGAFSSPLFNSNYGHRIIAAVLLAWLGDLFFVGRRRWSFIVGLVSFLLAHICYTQAMLLWGFGPVALGCFFLTILAVSSVVKAWLWPHVPFEMRFAVLAYIVMISLMLATTMAASPNHPRPLMALTGALLFYMSDIWVARDRFVSPGFINSAIGLPMYWAGQWLLISTMGLG